MVVVVKISGFEVDRRRVIFFPTEGNVGRGIMESFIREVFDENFLRRRNFPPPGNSQAHHMQTLDVKFQSDRFLFFFFFSQTMENAE